MQLKELLESSERIVAFTGAGLSTESGIPDFRSSSGLYLTGQYEGKRPEDILNRKFLKKDPLTFTSFYQSRILSMRDKKPNRAHFALKSLQDIGKLDCVVNQNIDNLLQTAGVQNVFDLHGNVTSFTCVSCGRPYAQEQYINFTGIPRCNCGGIVRPDTILFDEALNDGVYDAAYFKIKAADLVIVIGSSLVVQPACSLLDEIGTDCKFVILNKQDTPYDKRADLILREPCGEVLENVVKNLLTDKRSTA